jgi:hypothetical protein
MRDAILYATFDGVANPDGGDRRVLCDAFGRLIVATVPPAGSDEVQGKVVDGAAAGATKPVIVSGVDVGGLNQSLLVDALGRPLVDVDRWFGSAAPTVGQKVKADSIPVVLPSDQVVQVSLSGGSAMASATASVRAVATSATATAVIPAAGPGLFNYLHTITVGFDTQTALEKLVQIKEGAVLLAAFSVGKQATTLHLPYEGSWKQPTANTGMTVEIAAGGPVVTGRVHVTYHTGA